MSKTPQIESKNPFELGGIVEGAGPLGVRVLGDQGPTIHLIHGLGRVVAAFADVARALEGRARLVLVDNPGFGRSSSAPVPRTIEEHARLHVETLESLGLSSPVHVAGLSLGGMIAPVVARRLGSKAGSLAIFSSSSVETGFFRLSPTALLRMLGRVLLSLGLRHDVNMPEIVGEAVRKERPSMASDLDVIQEREGFKARHALSQIMAALRFHILPHKDHLPERTLIVVGSEDRLVSKGHSERLARLLGRPLLVLPGAAHDLGIDAPRWMAHILLEMASGRDPAAIKIDGKLGPRPGPSACSSPLPV